MHAQDTEKHNLYTLHIMSAVYGQRHLRARRIPRGVPDASKSLGTKNHVLLLIHDTILFDLPIHEQRHFAPGCPVVTVTTCHLQQHADKRPSHKHLTSNACVIKSTESLQNKADSSC